ncbi:hypothetical protein CHARACLAT_013516 [Characodon lateralis]|uniref:Uncharacterized protein n=1 Tax=Characodon lateralis TaxID=208331 RepID=A0ABU7EIT0_9TELE|nr:hypothetical protein [Characodon lateralis]
MSVCWQTDKLFKLDPRVSYNQIQQWNGWLNRAMTVWLLTRKTFPRQYLSDFFKVQDPTNLTRVCASPACFTIKEVGSFQIF